MLSLKRYLETHRPVIEQYMESIAEFIVVREYMSSEEQKKLIPEISEKLRKFDYYYDRQNLVHRFVHRKSGIVIERQYQGQYSFQLPGANQKLLFDYDRLVPKAYKDPIKNPSLVEIQGQEE